MMNIINGGKHADNPIDIQEFNDHARRGRHHGRSCSGGSEIFMTLNSWMSIGLSACLPPLMMFIIGTGRVRA